MRLNSHHTDEILMTEAVKGQRQAFENLYDRYSAPMYNYFMKMNRYDTHLAQDLTQDLFLKILEKSDQFNPSRSFKTWIYSIANNMCKNIYRHDEVVEKARTEWEGKKNHSPSLAEAGIDKVQFDKELKIEIALLDPAKRSSFILRFKHDFSIREIAEATGTSEGTVKSRLHYTIQSLAGRLDAFKEIYRNER